MQEDRNMIILEKVLPKPLRSHQRAGVQWMWTLYQQGYNGVCLFCLLDME